jgi:hypothetical protein
MKSLGNLRLRKSSLKGLKIEELRRKKFRISDGIIAQALMQAGEHF